jgi:hypothetical protein
MARLASASLCLLAILACGNDPQTGDGGEGPLDVISGWSGSPTMNPGIDCLTCHGPDLRASYKSWTIAGTVYPSPDSLADGGQPNVQILITDANGTQLTLVSNSAGNFYTEETLAFPLQSLMVQNGRHRMQMDLSENFIPSTVSSCNQCHNQPSAFSAPGRLFVEP